MAKRCGCASDTCACVITAGEGVEVSGGGSKTNPYIIDALPAPPSLTVQDENIVVQTGVEVLDFRGATVTAAAGDSGEVVVTVSTPAGIAGLTVQVNRFTSSGTWTKPANTIWVVAEVQGAGGGGGGATPTAAGQSSAGGGGGGGGYSRKTFLASALGSTEAVVVGTGGAAGAASNSLAGSGTDSSFHGVLAEGGNGALGGQPSSASVITAGGSGGGATGGDLNIVGEMGRGSIIVSGTVASLGSGGSSALAPGGGQPLGNFNGRFGPQGGGGGGPGDAFASNATGTTGGIGGNGLVIITSYIQT